MGRKSFLQSNRGASLVLVSIFSVIVISLALTLGVVSSMLLSNAELRNRQNQAYELSTSLSYKIETLIVNPTDDGCHESCIDLDDFISAPSGAGSGQVMRQEDFAGIPDSFVEVTVKRDIDGNNKPYYILTVTAQAAGETYTRRTEYGGTAAIGYTKR